MPQTRSSGGVTLYIYKHRAKHFPVNTISKMLSFKMNVNEVLWSDGDFLGGVAAFKTVVLKCCLCE